MKFTTRILPHGIGPSDPIVQKRAQTIFNYVMDLEEVDVFEEMIMNEKTSGEFLADLYRERGFTLKLLTHEAVFVATCRKIDACIQYEEEKAYEDMMANEPPIPRFTIRFS